MTEISDSKVCSLLDYEVETCGAAELRNLLEKRLPPSGKVYMVKVCNESISNVQYVVSNQETAFEKSFMKMPFHKWSADYFCFLDFPVFQLNAHGVCFTEDGKLIIETLYRDMDVAKLSKLVYSYGEEWPAENAVSWKFDDFGGDVLFPAFSMWSGVYFHALSECVTALYALQLYGLESLVAVPTPLPTSSVREIILSQHKGTPRKSTQSISFGRGAVLFSGMYRHAPLTPLFVEAMRNIRDDVLRRDAELWSATDRDLKGKKLFVSRPPQAVRPLINQADAEKLAEAYDYEVVYPDRLTFEQQVAKFSTANIVLGAHGAGLANAAFAPVGAVLFELRQLNRVGESPMWNSSYRKLSAAIGLRYGFEVFINEVESDEWDVDLAKLAAAFERLRSVGGRWQYQEDISNGYDKLYRGW